ENRIIWIGPRSGNSPFLESFALCIEHADLVATKFSKPETVLGVHMAPSRAGVGGWSGERSHSHALGIDFRDEFAAEVHTVEVVSRIRGNTVGAEVTIRERRILGDIPLVIDGNPLSRFQIHLILVVGAYPNLAVHVDTAGRDHRSASRVSLGEL